MAKRRSKLKAMAAAGDPWAIATLAKARAGATAYAAAAMRKVLSTGPFAEAAMRDATDIRQWTDGPKPASWRVYRLAQALTDGR
jgi:hypothetical protein